MLEIRNVSKIYRSKTGEEVRALDNVSISFPETGMVFILGKSGSGKSTLLNVMGGLDSYDGGEFIIKGKSSNDFGGSDFDAYRNTFIGFIFQEYNVLDDFTVGANIGLALELQGKKATDEAINDILAKVDLLDYAKRKPNELSGGQKQRVAIARALVKDPEIIMADEPTGALDSNTGKQIFDALKELSRTKLVLIVSHDRDFAERYADRIVELADGQIIEDVTKHEHEAERVSDGVHRINDHILRIESGYRLTAADLEMINDYLARNNGDVLLSGDGRVNEELRSAAGISKDGATTVFEGTTEKDIKSKAYNKDETHFIRSRLPMKNAVKMGASSLKHKKFRLFMTILLSFISFAMFGLSSTVAAYEQISGATASMLDSNVRNASITATVRTTTTYTDRDDISHWYNRANINEDDIAKLNAETGLNFVPVYTGGSFWAEGFSMTPHMEAYQNNDVYTGKFSGMVNFSREQFEQTGFRLTGEWPDAENEIVITEFMYRQFKEYGFKNASVDPAESVLKGTLTMDNGTNGILGKHISFQNGTDYKTGKMQTLDLEIVGVIDTGFDYDRYGKFLPQDENAPQMEEESGLVDMVLRNELEYEIGFGFHALMFTSQPVIDAIAANSSYNYIEIGHYMSAFNSELGLVLMRERGSADGDKEGPMVDQSYFYRVATMDEVVAAKATVEWLDGRTNGTLAPNEILIHSAYKSALEMQEAEVTLTAEQVAGLAAIYGTDNWNAADPDNDTVNFYDRLQRAAVLSYIKTQLAEVNGLRAHIEQDIANAGLSYTAEEYWQMQWTEGQLDTGYPYYYHDGVSDVSIENYYTVKSEAMKNPALVTWMEGLLGYDFPTDLSADEISNLALVLLNDFYGSDLTYTFRVDHFHWPVSNLYVLRDMEQYKPWENANMVALLIASDSNDVDSETAWNAKDEWEKQGAMESFYRYYYASNAEYEQYYKTEGYIQPTHTDDEITEICREMLQKLSGKTDEDILKELKIKFVERSHENDHETELSGFEDYVIAGFVSMPRFTDIFVSDSFYNYYNEWFNQKAKDEMDHEITWREETAVHADSIWSFAIAPMPADEATVAKLAAMHYAEEGYGLDVKFQMNNAVMATLGQFDEIIEIISQVFIWVGLALAVFSSFLLMNFISTSISYKKREIGILRAVGARSSDVFKIFFSEAFIIAMINFVMATVATVATVLALNFYMRGQGINITLLSFGPLQALLMLGISILVAAIASFLPVYRIAHKKPVDAIKDR